MAKLNIKRTVEALGQRGIFITSFQARSGGTKLPISIVFRSMPSMKLAVIYGLVKHIGESCLYGGSIGVDREPITMGLKAEDIHGK